MNCATGGNPVTLIDFRDEHIVMRDSSELCREKESKQPTDGREWLYSIAPGLTVSSQMGCVILLRS